MTRFAGRTANGIPPMARTHAEHPILRLDGLVSTPLNLNAVEIENLPHHSYLGTLASDDDGALPKTDWSGVRLADLVALAGPDSAARFVRVSAGPYGVPIPLADAERVLLCDKLDGRPLAVEEGGPWRLVVPGLRYFTSVKWVDRIDVALEEPDDSATRIAKARAHARDAKAAE